MMKFLPGFVLSRYLTTLFMKWMATIGCAVFTLIFLLDFSELVRKASAKPDVGFNVMVQMVFLKMPHLLQQIFPFLILFASMMTLWILNRHQEMTMMKTGGLSIWQILSPLVGLVWILGGIDLLVLNSLSTRFMAEYEHLNDRYFERPMENLTIAESGLWIREKQTNCQQIFHIVQVDALEKVLRDISVFQFTEQNQFIRRIEAAQGQFHNESFLLKEVWTQGTHEGPVFKEEMVLPTSLSLSQIKNTGSTPSSVSFWKLRYVAHLLKKSGLSGHKYTMYWHSLLARWIWLGLMVILAASCSLRPVRQQGTFALIGMGLMGAFMLYFLRDVTYALGNSGTLPIILAAWIPLIITGLLGMSALLYFEER